jgi:hypothetical protein
LYLLEKTNTTDSRGTSDDKKDTVEEQVVQEKKTSIFDSLSNVFQQTKPSENNQSGEKSEQSKTSKYQSITKNEGLLPPHIKHPILGKIFLFSETGEAAARTVVFLVNTLYLLDQSPDLSLFFKKKYDSIYFQEEGTGEPLFGVKQATYFGRL